MKYLFLNSNFKLFYRVVFFILCGSHSVYAGQKIYFRTSSDGTVSWCDADNLETHMDEDGKLASICYLGSGQENDGRSSETPFEVDTDGDLFRKYILSIVRSKKTTFPNDSAGRAEAERTLDICEDLGLPFAEEYICKLLNRGKRENKNSGPAAIEPKETNRNCPPGYIEIPENPFYATGPFCLMKYVASQGPGGRPISVMDQYPWVGLSREAAAAACARNGAGYELITNDQWMTAARNAESNPENWNEGKGPVGVGIFVHGPKVVGLKVAKEDSNPFYGSPDTHWSFKRTHVLTNGEVIWDMSGNVPQWVADEFVGTPRNGFTQSQFSQISPSEPLSRDRLAFAPLGNFFRSHGMGELAQSYTNGQSAATTRGGSGMPNDGIFTAVVGERNPGGIGFRCSYRITGYAF